MMCDQDAPEGTDAVEEAAGVTQDRAARSSSPSRPVPSLRLLFALAHNMGIHDGAKHGAAAMEKTQENVEGYMRAAEDWPDLWREIRAAKAKADP